MTVSLDAALSGMLEQQRNIELISNNLGNANTAGYKRVKVHFQDVLDTVEILEALRGELPVEEVTVPAGVEADAVERVFDQGPLQASPRELDFAIVGDGLFRVRLEAGGIAYTRAGTFGVDAGGQLVTVSGELLDPPITIPAGARNLEVGTDGTVTVLRPFTEAELETLDPDVMEDGVREAIGQIRLARFEHPESLGSIGASLYVETAESGAAIEGASGEEGFGAVVNGFVEGSNVDLAEEMTGLVVATRAYQMNLQAYRTIEEMLADANQMA